MFRFFYLILCGIIFIGPIGSLNLEGAQKGNNLAPKSKSEGAKPVESKKLEIYRKVVLVVEDTPLLKEILVELIKRLYSGIDVEEAADGQKGLEAFERIVSPFTKGEATEKMILLIITDWSMPEMAGNEMAKQIEERLETNVHLQNAVKTGKLKVTIIVVTGDELQKVIPTLTETIVRNERYLSKPYTPDELRRHTNSALEPPEAGLAEPPQAIKIAI